MQPSPILIRLRKHHTVPLAQSPFAFNGQFPLDQSLRDAEEDVLDSGILFRGDFANIDVRPESFLCCLLWRKWFAGFESLDSAGAIAEGRGGWKGEARSGQIIGKGADAGPCACRRGDGHSGYCVGSLGP